MDTSTPLDPSPAKLNAFCDSVMVRGTWDEYAAKAVGQCQRRAPMAVVMRLGIRTQFPTFAECAAEVLKIVAVKDDAAWSRIVEKMEQ